MEPLRLHICWTNFTVKSWAKFQALMSVIMHGPYLKRTQLRVTVQYCLWAWGSLSLAPMRAWRHNLDEKLAFVSESETICIHKPPRQNPVYPQTFQILSITLDGYYHDVIKQQVNNTNEWRKWISTNYCKGEEASHSAMAIIVLKSSSLAHNIMYIKKGKARN